MVGLLGTFSSVSVHDVTAGAFAASPTLLMWFGLAAALIASYTGLSVVRAPEGVGTAVNRTVAYPLMALFVINVLTTLPHKKSRKRRSALVHSGSWAGHLRYVRQTRPQGGTLNSMSPVSKFLDI